MAEVKERIRRTREDYEILLAEHGGSGLSLRAFAESKGIKPATLYCWHRRLRPRRGKKKPTLVPVRVVDASPAAGTTSGDAAEHRFEITVPGDRIVSVPSGFDAEELRRLLDVLDAAAC